MKIHITDLDFLGLPHSIAVFVVEGPDGLCLVECGPASTLPHLRKAFSGRGWAMSDFKQVFLSHIHFDHAGAAWAFADAGAQIYVHPKGLPHMAAPERLYQSAQMIYGDAMERLWGEMRPIPEQQLIAPADGEAVQAAGLLFWAHYTPGHAVHHIAWECSDPISGEQVVFTGDVAGVRIDGGPVMPPCPPPDINVEDWQQSLQLLRQLTAQRLFLTHFGEVPDKQEHLDALEARLLAWAAWMKPYAERGEAHENIVPEFEQFVRSELLIAGVSEANLARYEAANPAFMSVAGLMRYWRKKMR
jgi:glyoxylase-like metal-dependent hydrolase (beta-lactamase superfamily II)